MSSAIRYAHYDILIPKMSRNLTLIRMPYLLELREKISFGALDLFNLSFLRKGGILFKSEYAWVFLSKFLWLMSLLAVEYGGGCTAECQGCSHPSNFPIVSGDSPSIVPLSSTSMATTSSSTVMDLVRGRYLSGYPIKVRRVLLKIVNLLTETWNPSNLSQFNTSRN